MVSLILLNFWLNLSLPSGQVDPMSPGVPKADEVELPAADPGLPSTAASQTTVTAWITVFGTVQCTVHYCTVYLCYSTLLYCILLLLLNSTLQYTTVLHSFESTMIHCIGLLHAYILV